MSDSKVLFQPLMVLSAFDQLGNLLIKGLDADLELKRARRKPGDDLAQALRQAIRNHLEMKKMPRLVAFEKEIQNRAAHVHIEIESAVNEFELFHTAVEQPLQMLQEGGQGSQAHGDVQ